LSPFKRRGITPAWISDGNSYPFFAIAARRVSESPRSANVVFLAATSA